MKTTVVQYTTHPAHADENAALISAVMSALADTRPPGLHYQAWRGSDGVTFTHIAAMDESLTGNPLASLPAFQAFVAGLKERCARAPVRVDSLPIGRYPR